MVPKLIRGFCFQEKIIAFVILFEDDFVYEHLNCFQHYSLLLLHRSLIFVCIKNIPVERQRIIFKGKVLHDEKLLRDYSKLCMSLHRFYLVGLLKN